MARVALAVLTTLMVGPPLAAPQSAPTPAKPVKDAVVVLKFPSALITTQTHKQLGIPSGGVDKVAKINADPSGRAIVGGVADWQTAGFPSMLEMKVKKVGDSEVELKSTTPNSDLKLKLLFTGDVQKLFPQVVARKEDADAYRTEAYRTLGGKFFTGPLASLPDDKRTALLTFAHVAAQGTTMGSVTYKDHLYLVVDLGSDENVYNELRLDQAQRLNRVMNDKLLVILKAFALPVRDVPDIYGLKLEFAIPHRSFADQSATSATDKLEVYAPANLIRQFAEADITSQQLLDGSVVIVNSNRTQVALSGS
jgi:hypothetical protein